MRKMKAASIKSLMEIAHVDEETAKKVRAVWKATNRDDIFAAVPEMADFGRDWHHGPTLREIKRAAIDKLIGTHGVEYLGRSRKTGDAVYYANAGDSYATTVIFSGYTLRVGTWADLVESGSVR